MVGFVQQSAVRWSVTSLLALGFVALLSGCGGSSSTSSSSGKLLVVAAESPWGAVAEAIGGSHVSVDSLIKNPNTDPHEFTASAAVAASVETASVVIENGAGYDQFMTQLLSTGSTGPQRVVNAADAMRIFGPNVNPHLWYAIKRVPLMAHAIATAFAQNDPGYKKYFFQREAAFDQSLSPIVATINRIATEKSGAPVGETERVMGYLLDEAKLSVVSPLGFALSIESGTSPSASDTASMTALIQHHGIEALIYNQQTASPTTQTVYSEAKADHVPIVGVTETVQPENASFVVWQTRQVDLLAAALGVNP